MAPCAGVVSLGACWLLGDLGEPCTEVCGQGTPLDAAFTSTLDSAREVVDAVSRAREAALSQPQQPTTQATAAHTLLPRAAVREGCARGLCESGCALALRVLSS